MSIKIYHHKKYINLIHIIMVIGMILKNVKEFKNIIIKYLNTKYFVSNKILNFSKK